MKTAIEFIKKYSSFAVTAHANPEGDAIGASLAIYHLLRALGKKGYVYNQDPVPKNCAFLPGSRDVVRELSKIPPVDAVIVADSGDLDRPGEAFKKWVAGKPILNIDHHGTNDRFGDVNWVEPHRSSAGEMAAELFEAMNAPMSADAALCILTSIATDTGSFQFSNASPRAFEIASRAVTAGAAPEVVAMNYYHSKPASHLELLARCLPTLSFNADHSRGDFTITAAMFAETGAKADAAEGVVNLIMDVESVLVAVLFREVPDGWKASLRSKGSVNVAALAERHGGGGHKNAAGVKIALTEKQTKELIRNEVDELINRKN